MLGIGYSDFSEADRKAVVQAYQRTEHFKEDIMVLHQKIGVPIVGTWVNRPQNEFIWVRTYKDKAELEAKTKEFQAAVAAAGVKLGANVAKVEVREAESPFA